MASLFFGDCKHLNTLGIISITVASISILENSFPFYVLLKFSASDLDSSVQSFARTIRIYLLALIVTDMLGTMVVMPLFLLTELSNMECWRVFYPNFDAKNFCFLSYAAYFAYKLASMFLITFCGYSCFLHYKQSVRSSGTEARKNCICEAEISLTTAASSQSNHSGPEEVDRKSPQSHAPRRGTMSFMLVLIVIFSFFVACLPLLGLGPFNFDAETQSSSQFTNSTLSTTEDPTSKMSRSCMLHSFAKPKSEKEYIFLFSLLMASGVCSLILVYTFMALFGGRFKSSHGIFAEMTQFVTVQGFLFLATWIPILISICFAMSGRIVTHEVQSYLILITFLNCLSHPFFYGCCLSIVRSGYKHILKYLQNLAKCALAKKKSEGHTHVPTEEKYSSTTI